MIVSLIIPAYNCEEDIVRLLNSVLTLQYNLCEIEIIIVDNASIDKTAEVVEAFFLRYSQSFYRLKLFRNAENSGAPKALNKALSLCSLESEYLWKLDSDTELTPQSLTFLLKTFEENPGTGAVVSNILDSRGRETPVYTMIYKSFRKWTKTTEGFHYSLLSDDMIDGLNGASNLFPSAIIKKVGGFDEKYFLYYDDTDICYRIKLSGHTLRCAEKSLVFHYTKNSTGEAALKGMYYSFRSQFYFFFKYHSTLNNSIFIIVQCIIAPWRIMKSCLYYNCLTPKGLIKGTRYWCKSFFDCIRLYRGVLNG